MINKLKQLVQNHGDKAKVLSIERLLDLKNDIKTFEENESLNHFQKYIVNNIYNFKIPKVDFDIKSIIIIAVPRPMYAKVEFTYKDVTYPLRSLALSDIDSENAFIETHKYLTEFLSAKGYHIKSAPRLPLKRLAARSGLAVYGRNNICYVEGMGSSLTLVAYYTDIPCTEDSWTQVKNANICEKCTACITNCPTQAIRDDRFLIDNNKCLSFFNESPREFPDWIPLSAHNCIYDCLLCQTICPMNKDYVNNVIGPIKFSEQETEMIISKVSYHKFNAALKRKIDILGMYDWLEAIPRNLLVLFEGSKKSFISNDTTIAKSDATS